MNRMSDLEIAYTVDLLARLVDSIEVYFNDNSGDNIEAVDKEIKEATKLVNKYCKRIKTMTEALS
jgi:hypothetical protein